MQITFHLNTEDLPLFKAFMEELDRQQTLRDEQLRAADELERGTTIDAGLAAAVRESASRIAEAEQFVADNEVIVTKVALVPTGAPTVAKYEKGPDAAPINARFEQPLDVVPMMRAFASAKGLAAASAVLKEFGVPNVLSLSPEMHAAFAARVAL